MGIDKSILDISKYHFKRFRGASWLRIFYHNAKIAGPFSGDDEALSINEVNKFSILGEINASDKYRYNGKYEFLIQFSQREGFNWWRQTNFPLNEKNDESIGKSVEGYENISITWNDWSWGGLAKTVLNYQGCPPCLLDGSIGISNFFYCIGSNACNNIYVNSTPPNENPGIDEVVLWIRISDLIFRNKFTCKMNIRQGKISIGLLIICTFVIKD